MRSISSLIVAASLCAGSAAMAAGSDTKAFVITSQSTIAGVDYVGSSLVDVLVAHYVDRGEARTTGWRSSGVVIPDAGSSSQCVEFSGRAGLAESMLQRIVNGSWRLRVTSVESCEF